jgi:hypothetical protein
MSVTIDEATLLALLDGHPKSFADEILQKLGLKFEWCDYCCGYRNPHAHAQNRECPGEKSRVTRRKIAK